MKIRFKSLSRLIFPYILIAALPILSLLVTWGYVVNDHTRVIVAEQDQLVKTAIARVDEKIKFISELTYLICDSRAVNQYRTNAQIGEENDFFTSKQIQDLLSSATKNDEIAQIYFYDASTNSIIASDTILNDALLYFRYTYQVEGMEPETVLAQLKDDSWSYGYQYMGCVRVDNRPTQVLEYRVPLPLGAFGDSQPQLVVCLDAEHLFQDISDVLGDQGQFVVYSTDTVLYSNTGTVPELEGQTLSGNLTRIEAPFGTVYGLQRSLDNALWQIQYLCPEDSMVSGSWNLTAPLVLTIVLPVLMCISLCVYFTHKNYQEILDLLTLLRGQTPEPEEPPQYVGYHMVRRYADRVIRKNISYEAQISQIQVSQRSSTLDRLLRNAFRSETQKQEAVLKHGFHFADSSCLCLCLQMEDINTDGICVNGVSLRNTITSLLQTDIGTQLEVMDIHASQLVYILGATENAKALTDAVVSLLTVQLCYPYDLDLKIGVGDPVDNICAIHKSYEQALEVIRYSESTGGPVRSYSQLGQLEDVVFYPVLTDDKISNYMIAGHRPEARAVVLEIYNKNFRENTKLLSPRAIEMVRYRIFNAITSVASKQDVFVPEEVQQCLKQKNTEVYFTQLTGVIDMIVDKIEEKKSDTQNVLAARVQTYIQENFSNVGLSIKQIANHFHFHENYISNLYKEEFNENLSSAIERMRIEQAAILLRQSDVKVGQVAEAVGYSSDSTFRRAFKKIMGVSPADYRSMHTQ